MLAFYFFSLRCGFCFDSAHLSSHKMCIEKNSGVIWATIFHIHCRMLINITEKIGNKMSWKYAQSIYGKMLKSMTPRSKDRKSLNKINLMSNIIFEIFSPSTCFCLSLLVELSTDKVKFVPLVSGFEQGKWWICWCVYHHNKYCFSCKCWMFIYLLESQHKQDAACRSLPSASHKYDSIHNHKENNFC